MFFIEPSAGKQISTFPPKYGTVAFSTSLGCLGLVMSAVKDFSLLLNVLHWCFEHHEPNSILRHNIENDNPHHKPKLSTKQIHCTVRILKCLFVFEADCPLKQLFPESFHEVPQPSQLVR